MDVVLAGELRERSAAADRVSLRGRSETDALIDPFDVLYEAELPRFPLPESIERVYGSIGFAPRATYSNFVSSMDGVVTLGSAPSAGSEISGRNRADRFLMGLLRACADAVLLGAGTLRATPGHLWTAEHIYPDFASAFAELRSTLGRKPRPRLVVLSASGDVPVSHTAIVAGATIVTTAAGAARLQSRLPDSCDVIEAGDGGGVDLATVVDAMRGRGFDSILTEGGPHVMGEMIRRGLLDEVFLTISPVIAGRNGEPRLGMVAGVELLPGKGGWSALRSARRHGDFLFLRYALRMG